MTDTTAQSIPQTVPNADDTQGTRRATEVSSASGAEPAPARISSEVLEKAARRMFTAEYKQCILMRADACGETELHSEPCATSSTTMRG